MEKLTTNILISKYFKETITVFSFGLQGRYTAVCSDLSKERAASVFRVPKFVSGG
jgi:hypothetical protein